MPFRPPRRFVILSIKDLIQSLLSDGVPVVLDLETDLLLASYRYPYRRVWRAVLDRIENEAPSHCCKRRPSQTPWEGPSTSSSIW